MAIKNKRKDPKLYTYDKYECWWEDHASDCQWKAIKEAEKVLQKYGFETKFDGIGETSMKKMTREHYKIQMKALRYRKEKRGIDEYGNPKRIVWRWTYSTSV